MFHLIRSCEIQFVLYLLGRNKGLTQASLNLLLPTLYPRWLVLPIFPTSHLGTNTGWFILAKNTSKLILTSLYLQQAASASIHQHCWASLSAMCTIYMLRHTGTETTSLQCAELHDELVAEIKDLKFHILLCKINQHKAVMLTIKWKYQYHIDIVMKKCLNKLWSPDICREPDPS